ncbi:MAG: L-seryl-tRNA(Sec) selenium transferase [Tepidisphaeraceae bacterium]
MAGDLGWIPSVDAVVRELQPIELPRPALVAIVRRSLAELRASPPAAPIPHDALLQQISTIARRLSESRLRPVINGTGVIIHTNLGRSPLGAAAAQAVVDVATQYNTLEYDVAAGERGKRCEYVEQMLAILCEAPSAMLVNNCAAGLVLILNALIDRPNRTRVVISRGELVQIGGGFRVPEILEAAGATLHEVGTTNQTTLEDYRSALNIETAMILKVHRSNFYMEGFVASPPTSELAMVARAASIPFVEDLGSGAVFETRDIGKHSVHEPTPGEILKAGADLVCFSGDKLLGGPQAGVIAGRADAVARLKRSPLYRALRVDKITTVAMQATVDQLLAGDIGSPPVHEMLRIGEPDLRERAKPIVDALRDGKLHVKVGNGMARVGGGSLPATEIPSITLDIRSPSVGPDELAARLRRGRPPVIGYVADQHLRLDLRTIFPSQDCMVIDALRRLAESVA